MALRFYPLAGFHKHGLLAGRKEKPTAAFHLTVEEARQRAKRREQAHA